ncbi:CsbD family protein [soil metagenome]
MPPELHRAVGLFSSRRDAEAALMQLRDSGFNMDKVSVVNKNAEADSMHGAAVTSEKDNKIAEAAGKGAKIGGIGGGTIGLIGSLGILAIPGVGLIAELGVLLANTVLGGAIGAAGGGLVGALVGWGLPEDRAQYYSDRVNKSGDYLVMVEGDTADIQNAQTVLTNNRISDWQTFSATNASSDRTTAHSATTDARTDARLDSKTRLEPPATGHSIG